MKMRWVVSLSLMLVLGLAGQAVRAQGVLDLTETYSEAGLTFNYPAEWNVEVDEDGVILLQNKPEIDRLELKPGEAFIGFLLPSDSPFPPADNLDDAFEILYSSLQTETEQLGEPEPIKIGEMEGIQVAFITEDTDSQLAITLVDTQMFIIFLQTPKDELANSLAQFTAVLETVTYDAEVAALPELTKTYNEEGLSFQYPQGWMVEENERGFLFLKSARSADIEDFDLAEGQIVIPIVTPADFARLGVFNLSPEEAIQIITDGEEVDFSSQPTINNRAALYAGFSDSSKDSGSLAIPFEDGTVLIGYRTTPGNWAYFQALFFAIAETVEYQAPPNALPAPIAQWATGATATSEFGVKKWSAKQAEGEPNTATCADLESAWASATPTGKDTLTVTFAEPVHPTQINIHQTFNPGAITSVELVSVEGDVLTLPDSADPVGNTSCPGVFTLDIDTINPPINGIIINLDQTLTGNWNEIDAVELIGYPISE